MPQTICLHIPQERLLTVVRLGLTAHHQLPLSLAIDVAYSTAPSWFLKSTAHSVQDYAEFIHELSVLIECARYAMTQGPASEESIVTGFLAACRAICSMRAAASALRGDSLSEGQCQALQRQVASEGQKASQCLRALGAKAVCVYLNPTSPVGLDFRAESVDAPVDTYRYVL